MRRSSRLACSLVALGLAGFLAAPASAALFANYTAAVHDRFTSGTTLNPTFLLAGQNLSGIAYDATFGGGGAQGAVLISPQHFIVADHFRPGTVNFVDSTGVTRSYTGITYTRLTTTYINGDGDEVTLGSDIAIGRLGTAIPSSDNLAPLPIAVGDPAAFNGLGIYTFGRDNQAGRNIIDETGVAEYELPAGTPRAVWAIAYDFDTPQNGGTGGVGDDEIGLVGGDSGYTTVTLIDGQLAIVGANFAISTSTPGPEVNYTSFSTLASEYLDQIQSIVSADGQIFSTMTIPEPSTALLLIAGGTLALIRRPRRLAA